MLEQERVATRAVIAQARQGDLDLVVRSAGFYVHVKRAGRVDQVPTDGRLLGSGAFER